MAHDFKKLTTNSAFPNLDNVEVYKYDNQFDYSRYDYTQMELMLCSVPWDMGEAHIGNRTISGIGNVVYFGSKENRDAWFDAIPNSQCFRFSTKFKELHREQIIDVPIPYDVCARYNYLKVHYALFANDESPVMYEDDEGVRDWFWFVREVEFVAPNTTRLHLLDDAFQTWIYDVDITGMVLERGHAPMFAVKTDEYLTNPIENNEYLLTEDVNFGSISQVKHIDVLQLNAGNMYACIATSANPRVDWGSKAGDDWKTPAGAGYTANGNPSFFVFALPVSQLATFLANVTNDFPQFKQTVQGVFFASDDLLTIGQAFTFANVECHMVSSSRKQFEFVQLEKSQFGYASRYANIAKLYTSPYAHIEVTDENGNVDIVRIEDTNGTLDVSAALSLAYPFVTIDAHILGAGGNVSASVSYRNVTAHTFNVSGQWYETLRTWNVPTFAVVLDAAKEYDYSTHFDRLQRVNDYEKAYANASANATTARTNRDASATTARDNAYNSADTALANANASADTTKSNADASATTARDNAYRSADTALANVNASADTTKANADASAATAKANADASATTAKNNVATIAAANKANTDDSADAAATNVATIAAANKSNADASATTARTNVATIAGANKSNADDSADTLVDNATLNTTANTATTTRSNQSASTDSTNSQNFNSAITTADNLIVNMSATSTISANEQQGAISAGASVANGLIGAAGSAISLDPVGAVSSVASGIVGGATTIASTAVANGLTAAQAGYTVSGNNAHETASNTKTALDTTNHNDTATDLTTIQNTLITGTTANSAATTKGNATRTQTAENTAAAATETTTKANALRTQTAENTAAALTQTTTKANATRTQTAENTAAAATETTTKANAKRTYDTATANNAATNTTTKANATRSNTADRANALNTYDTATANNAATNTTTKANATRSNTAERANASRSYNTTIANNERDYNTAIANAGRDRTNAQRDIENDIMQAALRAPFVYGEFANGESSANKPIALFANIVTQSKSAISSAGDEFLRYGYTFDKFWEFDGNWNVGKYFTYWKLRDFWVSNLTVPDMYMDKLRFFLFGGVTIWKNPSDIGKRTIYENFA